MVRENRGWRTKDGEPTPTTSNQGAFNVDLQWQNGIRALTVEVEVQPRRWSSNGVQAKWRKKGCEGWWRVLWGMNFFKKG